MHNSDNTGILYLRDRRHVGRGATSAFQIVSAMNPGLGRGISGGLEVVSSDSFSVAGGLALGMLYHGP
jgi:hypothetical protein